MMLTESMEDYLEMFYRIVAQQGISGGGSFERHQGETVLGDPNDSETG